MTERLFYSDPYLRAFSSRVVERCEVDGQPAVELEATAFYPTAGGQPHDTGTLNDARVVDVQIDDSGRLLHVLDRPLHDTAVNGELDWTRRLDHMQQHTGQHILSQAFGQCCQAETVGFHMGETVSTIDLDRAPLDHAQAQLAENAANEIVLACQQVTARFVDKEELAALPLRKPPAVEGPIRVVEVHGFDWSACGGTHLTNSGQVGPIKVVRVERRNDKTRIHFLCGRRALDDYASKHATVQSLAAYLTTSETEILPSLKRMEAEIKDSRKAMSTVQEELLTYKVTEWIEEAEWVGEMRIISLAFDERDNALLKETARRLVEQPGVIALLASQQPRPQFVYARADDIDINMGALMRSSSAVTGGRGGGRPQFAQGGAPENTSIEPVLESARQQIKSL